MGSGNKSQKHRKGLWSFGERRVEVAQLGGREEGQEMHGQALGREAAPNNS